VDVAEGGDVAEVKERDVTKRDGLGVQKRAREDLQL
jgi:hypothetical protein